MTTSKDMEQFPCCERPVKEIVKLHGDRTQGCNVGDAEWGDTNGGGAGRVDDKGVLGAAAGHK